MKEVEINRFFDSNLKSTFESISDSSQSFSIYNSRDTVIIGNYGTLVLIEKNTFIDGEGNIPDTVNLELVEVFTINDMLKNGLSTTSNGNLIETDGMIFLNAVNNYGNYLSIAKNKSIHIETPSFNNIDDIKIFKGRYLLSGLVNWENPGLTNKYLFRIPLKKLDFFPEGYSKSKSIGASLNSNNQINEVKNILTQVAADTSFLDYCGIAENLVRSLYNEQYSNTLISTREFEIRMQYIHRSCNEEVFRLYLSNIDLNLWEVDSMAYEMLAKEQNSQAKSFRIFKSQRKTKIKNGSVKNKIYEDYISKTFEKNEVMKRRKELRDLTTNSFSTTTLGWINCDRFWNYPNAIPLKLEIIVSNTSAKLEYCKTFLVFSSLKSILDLKRYDNGKFHLGFGETSTMILPKGENVLVVSIAHNGNTPFLGIKEITLGEKENEKIELKQTSFEELRNQLSQYNKPRIPNILNFSTENSCCQNSTDLSLVEI